MHLHGRLARAAARGGPCGWVWNPTTGWPPALTSLAHADGLTGGLFSTVSAGAALLLPPLGHADGITRFLSRQRATFALGTPWVYASFVMFPPATTSLGSLRRCYSGGGALSEAVRHAFASRYGVELRETCGA